MSGEQAPLHGRHDGADGVYQFLTPIHRDGHKFIGAGLLMTCVLFWLWQDLSWIALLLTGWLVYFFRDPHRVTPLRSGLVIAPADGRIVAVSQVRPPQELGLGDALRARISICLSMLDVHVNRSPIAGQVVRSIYVPGVFMSAARDKASEDNERHALVIAEPNGAELAVVQIAGIVSRRIMTYAGEGDTLATGQRYGIIRFGSRVDIYLPPGRNALVCLGQRAIAGETVIADLESDENERAGRRG